MKSARRAEERNRRKTREAVASGIEIRRRYGSEAAIEFLKSSNGRNSESALADAVLASMLMDASTRSKVVEGVELGEAVLSATSGGSPPRFLEPEVRSLLGPEICFTWIDRLGNPRAALDMLRATVDSWPANSFVRDSLRVRILLAQTEPGARSEGVELATDLLLAGSDWLSSSEVGQRPSAANQMALALVQVPITESPLITEAARLAEFAHANSTDGLQSAFGHTLAVVRIRQGRIEEAGSLLRPILEDEELSPRDFDEVLMTLALVLAKLGHPDQALVLMDGGRKADLVPAVLSELELALVAPLHGDGT